LASRRSSRRIFWAADVVRVLVTRAMPEAEETASDLRTLGHMPILAPLRTVEHVATTFSAEKPIALIATSRNAITQGTPVPADWLALPVYCVGRRTADAVGKAGFADIRTAGGDAALLGRKIIETCAPGSHLLYLAGEPRGPELETVLQQAGMRIEARLRYRMHRVPTLPEAAATALAAQSVDAILHFSSESARAFFILAQSAGLIEAASAIRQFCLSPAVAEAATRESGRELACFIAPLRFGGSLIEALHREFR
jgi:uroporphyrinogen-III synthase